MPEGQATITSAAALDAEPEATPTGPTRRKLGLGGWISAGWLILLVIVSLATPLLTADPVINDRGRVTEGCGTGDGLPLYHPLACRDLDAKRNQQKGEGDDGEFSHLTGVDASGRDTFSQTVHGTRTTLIIAVASIVAATIVGGLLGLVSGYFRGWLDTVITGLFDVMIAFPALILALLVVTNFAPPGEEGSAARRVPGIIIALAIVATPILGRIARASTLTWAEREFVTAAKALGAKPFRIMFRDVLPNVAPAMMSIAMLGIGIVIVTESGLALLGLGVPDDTMSWGRVVASGGSDFRNYPHVVFVPSVAIVVTVCALNFLGDALRQKFDVRESAL
jgi:peptide/nickel transport system permease protein